MNVAALAWRNLRRHPVRTTLKVLGLGLATAVMVIWGSVNRGFTKALREAATKLELGDLQIHHPAYRKSRDPYHRLTNDPALAGALRAAGFDVTARLYGSALAASGDQSAGIQIRGVDEVTERQVTTIDRHLADGRWVEASRPKGLVVGRDVARRLGLSPGKELIVLGQAMDGAMASEVFVVQGVLRTLNREIDDRGVFMPAQSFREFFQMPAGVHELAVVKRGGEMTPRDVELVKSLAGPADAAEVKTWKELRPLLARMLQLLSITIYFTMSFTYLALGGLILNTVFMTIYDRMREYGIMKAVGMLPKTVATLILAEACWLAGLAGVVALAVGLPVTARIAAKGLDASAMFGGASFAGVSLEPVMHAELGVVQTIVPLILLLVCTPLFALYPALEASRITPKEALQRL